MKYSHIIPLFLVSIIGISQATNLQECKHSAPDQITTILPNYTGSIQPCSYSGFAPMDDKNDSALYYWYFPHQTNQADEDVPLLIWLQGGPGAASMLGLFAENGPFKVINNGKTVSYFDEPEGQSWAYYYNVLFIDQPVGTGFSYTSDNSYANNMDEMSNMLYKGIQYFLKLHPETQKLDWYYTGESHAGRYCPALAYWTLKYNDEIKQNIRDDIIINLKGTLIGDGYFHGVNQRITEIYTAKSANMISPQQYEQTLTLSAKCQSETANNISTALNTCDDIFRYIGNMSNMSVYAINMTIEQTDDLFDDIEVYLNNDDVYDALHVQDSKKGYPFYDNSDDEAYYHLSWDMLNNSLMYLEPILEQIPVLLYEGNYDTRDGAYGTYYWFPLLKDPYNQILDVPRNLWYKDGEAVGSYAIFENLTYIVVNDAGHYAPYFQLENTVKMVKIFTQEKNNWDAYTSPTPIPKIQCDFLNNCGENGVCDENGFCKCQELYGLADCSVQAVNIDSSSYELRPRDYLFFNLAQKFNQVVQISGESNGDVEMFYSSMTSGPIGSPNQADAYVKATPGSSKARYLHISSPNQQAFLTLHNTNYNKTMNFQIKSVPTPIIDDDEFSIE